MTPRNLFGTETTLRLSQGSLQYHQLELLVRRGVVPSLDGLPHSIRIVLEAAVRGCDDFAITREDVLTLARWSSTAIVDREVPFRPARVILQDFTGVPLLVDIAAMRAAVHRLGRDPRQINPVVPVELVVDHSVQVDAYGSADALVRNTQLEMGRNRERYEFLRWGQNAIRRFRMVPPASGIVHQVNLEYLARVAMVEEGWVYPDTLVGTDSHTPMVNGLGVLGWGVGGIEAEAVMLGQPLFLLLPQVVGVKLVGALREGVTATDLTLAVTQQLRQKGVVDKFVEFYGVGLSSLAVEDRATIANMAPEYGATCSYFPVDALTLDYMRRTGRSAAQLELCERYYKEQGLFRTDHSPDPQFTETLEMDLATIVPSLAGPKRPQDRIPLSHMKPAFQHALRAPLAERGFALADSETTKQTSVRVGETETTLSHGSVVIAAITSCTNTSNPSVLITAGLLAKKAVEAGLRVAPHVKTSLAPGSKVVTSYLQSAGLLPYLEQLGFFLVGYGCTTCIGNSGPLPEVVDAAIGKNNLVAAAVLSGNRNFEGRIHPSVRANYLASPPLVVAYALAGTVDFDLDKQPLGTDEWGKEVYLRDLWPTQREIQDALRACITPAMFTENYARIEEGSEEWKAITGQETQLYHFHPESTYIQEPPFFQDFSLTPSPIRPIQGAYALCVLGDSITTDHISPAGAIAATSPAGRYLQEQGVTKVDFNSYGARRGNDRVMVRGTFANIRLKNLMVPGVEGNVTLHVPSGEQMSIFDAAERYKKEHHPLLVIAGKEYGSGSSRDWAAKGVLLLGVRAVLAESFERIHRSNLVGMGILPLMFQSGDSAEKRGLTGKERYHVLLPETLVPKQTIDIQVERPDGSRVQFSVQSRLDSAVEVRYYQQGGILQTVLRDLLANPKASV